MSYLFQDKKGFSLIEMIVVIAVMAILMSILLIDYNSIKQQLALRRGASQFAQDIRAAQGLALGTTEHSCNGGTKASGFGICVGDGCFGGSGICDSNCTYAYTLFANCFKNPSYEFYYEFNQDDIIKTVKLEANLKICFRYDANCDGIVDDGDKSYVEDSSQHSMAGCKAPDWCKGADVTRDGQVTLTGSNSDVKAIQDQKNTNQSTVVFEPPQPTTNYGGVPGYPPPGYTLQDFRIIVNGDLSKARDVSINSAGLIEIK